MGGGAEHREKHDLQLVALVCEPSEAQLGALLDEVVVAERRQSVASHDRGDAVPEATRWHGRVTGDIDLRQVELHNAEPGVRL